MFKRKDEVTTFIDYLEDFVKAVITNHFSQDVEDATYLNRKREALEEYILTQSGLLLVEAGPDTFDCPDCGSKMLLRTNRVNGDKFWGCTKYPDCRGTRDSAGLSKADRREEAERNRRSGFNQEAGYSFNKKRSPVAESGPDS